MEISPALAAVFELMNKINKLIEENQLSKSDAKKVSKFMEDKDKILGVLYKEEPLSKELKSLLEEREKARKNKDFVRADILRIQLKDKGIAVEDTVDGQRWKRIL